MARERESCKMISRPGLCVLGAAIFIINPLFAGLSLGVDANYLSQTAHATDLSGAVNNSWGNGYGIMPSLRYEFPVISLFSVGIGAYAVLGTVYPELTGGATAASVTGSGFGGDLWLTLEARLPVKPFARFMLGRYSAEQKVTIPTTLGAYETAAGISGLQYNILGGVRLPLWSIIELYAQAGYSATGNATPTLRSATLNGTAASVNLTTTGSYTTGFLTGAGIMLKF